MVGKPSVFVGQVFTNNQGEEAVLIKYESARKVMLEFKDDHSFKGYYEVGDIKNGSFKNPYNKSVCGVGYLGVGRHRATDCGVLTPAYRAWTGALTRCYSEESRHKWESYKDCTVHEDWHNFQVFAEWYSSQENFGCGYHLDKDLLVQGNRVYSEDTCCLIPEQVNYAIAGKKSSSRGVPEGVCVDKRYNKYNSSISRFGRDVYLGFFEDAEEAHKVYRVAKKEYLIELAELFKGKISKSAYLALLNWSLDIEKGVTEL